MKTVSQLLGPRRGLIISVSPYETVLHALQVMAERDVGALLVTEKGNTVGIISERDYARKMALKGKYSHETQVQEIMAHPVICVSMHANVDEAMAIMSEHNIRHLPVVDDYKDVVGVVSMRDLVRETIAEQTFVIRQLESYITA